MSTRDKWVRRFAVDETAKHKNGFTIYKITSVLFPIESPEAVTVVSVWKRYSDVQRLHRAVRALHSGLLLRGSFPVLPKNSYFKRFQSEVIEERAKSIKTLLEFIAEHPLLFTSTDFVNFLQTGYPEPMPRRGVINAIRSSLHLPIEETPPLEYQTSDDETKSPTHSARTPEATDGATNPTSNVTNQELDVSQIPIYEAANVEVRESPQHKISKAESFESITSIDSINSDFYDELSKVTIEKTKPSVKTKTVLPDLINFDAPSTSHTSRFEDYHTMRRNITDSETVSINSTCDDFSFSSPSNLVRVKEMENSYVFESPLFENSPSSLSNLTGGKDTDDDDTSMCAGSVASSKFERARETDCASDTTSIYEGFVSSSMSNVGGVKETEDSYVFEAGYLLAMGARCEDRAHYRRAFHFYRAGIEKMLIGVRSDSDAQRRTLIKQKISKYLSYAESIYKNHLGDADENLLSEPEEVESLALCPPPISMLRRPYEDLSLYRVLDVLGSSVMLVLHRTEQTCYAMKVVRKIPHNLTEFDEYFLQRTNETRQPVLPTLIPYMVPLHAYIETSNLIFLILSYAPGKKLFDYIKDYTKSLPTTPNREVNLENVFTEPSKQKKSDIANDNIDEVDSIAKIDSSVGNIQDVNENIEVKTDSLDNAELSVNELLINSQKLLQNVDKVLTEASKTDVKKLVKEEDVKIEIMEGFRANSRRDIAEKEISKIPLVNKALPGSAACCWASQLLVAIESLHNCGVICRDLNPRNILLGDKGQIILTYFIFHPGLDMALSKTKTKKGELNLYIAPELYRDVFIDAEMDEALDKVCDFWSYGAILYELLCGVPLSFYHRSTFTSHTILQLPDGLSLEIQSLLTQLLTYEPSQRLGGGKAGVEEIKQHPYFHNINWSQVYKTWTVPR
ncbi:unnamed protein product [Parnassius apollo]|uniref:(apollo) hypothetical protein n=1 Tax=Parnassius apollo TaxID=110799 RepID=A0A8S3X209_PARAO|nr:unnamed protein product [Parnassius apollo]